jgi:hypothetical protein
MPILELSDAQVVALVKQLPPERQRAALLGNAGMQTPTKFVGNSGKFSKNLKTREDGRSKAPGKMGRRMSEITRHPSSRGFQTFRLATSRFCLAYDDFMGVWIPAASCRSSRAGTIDAWRWP